MSGRLDLPSELCLLAKERPLFHSEADFQHALAWRIHQSHPDAMIRLETRHLLPTGHESQLKSSYLDLMVTLGSEKTAIELKRFVTTFPPFAIDGEVFQFSDQAADDLLGYGFLFDIVRLEAMLASGLADRAYALLLTNSPALWKLPQSTKAYQKDRFRLHEGIVLGGVHSWPEAVIEVDPVKNRSLTLAGSYTARWRDYSRVEAAKNGESRYLLIEVSPLAETRYP